MFSFFFLNYTFLVNTLDWKEVTEIYVLDLMFCFFCTSLNYLLKLDSSKKCIWN